MKIVFRSLLGLFFSISLINTAFANSQVEKLASNINKLIQEAKTKGYIELPRVPLPNRGLTQGENNPSIRPYIVGGNNASRGEYPEFALVVITDGQGNIRSFCGGSLIATNKILTAGHCSQSPATSYFVIPNFYSFNDNVNSSSLIQGIRISDHPQYDFPNFDIGIITLVRSAGSAQAKIHRGTNSFAGDVGTVIGTGRIVTEPPAYSDFLQEVDAPITSNSECNANYLSTFGIQPITDDLMCAGFSTNGDGACFGDSGGPLSTKINGQRVVVGTVSTGNTICETNRATQIYARLSAMTDFIRTESPQTEFVTSDSDILPIAPILLLLED